MKLITIDGPLEIAEALSRYLHIPLITIDGLIPVNHNQVLIVGRLAHERYPQADCKVLLHKSNESFSFRIYWSFSFW